MTFATTMKPALAVARESARDDSIHRSEAQRPARAFDGPAYQVTACADVFEHAGPALQVALGDRERGRRHAPQPC